MVARCPIRQKLDAITVKKWMDERCKTIDLDVFRIMDHEQQQLYTSYSRDLFIDFKRWIDEQKMILPINSSTAFFYCLWRDIELSPIPSNNSWVPLRTFQGIAIKPYIPLNIDASTNSNGLFANNGASRMTPISKPISPANYCALIDQWIWYRCISVSTSLFATMKPVDADKYKTLMGDLHADFVRWVNLKCPSTTLLPSEKFVEIIIERFPVSYTITNIPIVHTICLRPWTNCFSKKIKIYKYKKNAHFC